MAPISLPAISESLEQAFRAAFLLTGSMESAERAVLNGIAALEFGEDVEKELIAKTVEGIVRKRENFLQQVEHSLAARPRELQRLLLLPPVSRDVFLLRVLFGIDPATCVSILNLTVEEFEASLCVALEELPRLGAPIRASGPAHQMKEAQE